MKTKTSKLRIALIQIRELPPVALHEQTCFMERLGLAREDFKIINLVVDPRISWSDLADVDLAILGGAAAHSATIDYPFTEPLTEVVKRIADEGFPTFGSCWGHQFMARALGGAVITDHERSEVGTFAIELTDAGAADPMLEGLPRRFSAHMGHHDRVSVLPPGGVELAFSDRCRNQIYRLADKPIYGTQFHAEMSSENLIERLSYYRESYLPCDEEFEALKRNALPTPESDAILHRFLDVVTG